MRAGDVCWADGTAWQAWTGATDWWTFDSGSVSRSATLFELRQCPDFEWIVRNGKRQTDDRAVAEFRQTAVNFLKLTAASLRHPSKRRRDAAAALDEAADQIMWADFHLVEEER